MLLSGLVSFVRLEDMRDKYSRPMMRKVAKEFT